MTRDIGETPPSITEDEFLVGPGRDPGELDVDPIFAKDWPRLLEEFAQFEPQGLEHEPDEPVTVSDMAPGYTFQPVQAGVLLLDPDGKPCGGYLSCDLVVDGPHRGRGLGAELVVEMFLRQGSTPTWYLDTPAYSPAGEAAHRSAWRTLCQPELTARKRAQLNSDNDNAERAERVAPGPGRAARGRKAAP